MWARKVGVNSALVRFDIGSGDARPLGTGPPVVSTVSHIFATMMSCGWEDVWVSSTLKILRLRDLGWIQPLPLGMVGDVLSVGDVNGKRVARRESGGSMESGVWEVAIASTVPEGLGFFLMPCSAEVCGIQDWFKYWMGMKSGSCVVAVGSKWCEWRLGSLPVGMYLLQNDWEHLIWVLGSLAVVCVLITGIVQVTLHARGLAVTPSTETVHGVMAG